MNDFQERLIAAQDLKDECKKYGIRLNINGDGTITLYHGTSKAASDEIMKNGFHAGTYFSHAKTKTGYADVGPSWYANVKNKDGCLLEVNIDARCIEFASGSGEFYCPNAIRFNSEKNMWCDINTIQIDNTLENRIKAAEERTALKSMNKERKENECSL